MFELCVVSEIAQARPTLHATLMQRMTDVLSRMLNDPATRAALCGGGEDSLEGDENQAAEPQPSTSQSAVDESPSTSVPQLSSLSIHSSSSARPEDTEMSTPENNALDLSQMPSDLGASSSSSKTSGVREPSEIVHNNISELQDKLSTMREGFIER